MPIVVLGDFLTQAAYQLSLEVGQCQFFFHRSPTWVIGFHLASHYFSEVSGDRHHREYFCSATARRNLTFFASVSIGLQNAFLSEEFSMKRISIPGVSDSCRVD